MATKVVIPPEGATSMALIYGQRLLFLEYAPPARGYPLLRISRRPSVPITIRNGPVHLV